ncbi:hypothetical protein [Anabaena azotica]|uniref:hypothetical protein n=1 Tax=Anabaena azotica TaxID=197653 RepID=UPI0039A4FB78
MSIDQDNLKIAIFQKKQNCFFYEQIHWDNQMVLIPEIFDWAFSKKITNLIDITEHFGEMRGDLFKLFEVLHFVEQLRSGNCSNIQEKFADTTSWSKLPSLNSELFFANEFAKMGFSVSLIPDNALEYPKKSPDISVLKDGREFLIEVALISGDETTSEIGESIATVARETHFRVEIQYSEEFSIPVVKSDERKERENLIDRFIDEFKKIIQTIDQKSLPQNRDILGCKVTFTQPLYGKRGYYAGCVTGAINIPDEKFKEEITFRVQEKAKKRMSWNETQQNKPYLVALDIQQLFMESQYLVSLLFGERCYFEPPSKPKYTELPEVNEAKAHGWQKLLEEVGFSEQICPVIQPGIFITNPFISQNVTGIIARIGGELYCLPNPFAEKSINCLDLQQEIPWPVNAKYY